MKNFLIHGEQIDGDFTSLMFAMYMDGEWGITVGYQTSPLWYVNNMKVMLDYQALASADCNNEYLAASQGHISYDCCTSGSTRVVGSTQINCCPVGYSFRNSDGMCVSPGDVVKVVSTVPCPCCPPGYTYLSDIGMCRGVSASDIVSPIVCEPRCADGFGNQSALIACSGIVPDSVLLSAPSMGTNSSLCYETMVTPWHMDCKGHLFDCCH